MRTKNTRNVFITPEVASEYDAYYQTEMLARFGNLHISTGVYFSPDFEILDATEKQSTAALAFIAASVQKQK
jgi:hypothetical protein